jgi:hypothetical protein
MLTESEKLDRKREHYRRWYLKNGKTEVQKERVRNYQRGRRKDPAVKLMAKASARRYREKHRLRRLVYQAQKRAIDRGVEFDLDYLFEIGGLRPDACECCSIPFDYSMQDNKGRPKPNTPSLDRINPALGYVRGNIGIICWRCNAIKRDSLISEIEAIAAYMKRYSV